MPVIIDSVLRVGEGKILRKLKRIAQQVNSIEEDFAALSDTELRALTPEFRQRLADGETLDELLPEAFAVAREAARRTSGVCWARMTSTSRPRNRCTRPIHSESRLAR